MTTWSPTTWQEKPAQQQVGYTDTPRLHSVLAEMARLPPLVTSWEIENLRAELAKAARGDAFLLQGGDCAESFDDCRSEPIAAKLKILLQMSLVLVHGTRKPVIRVGRIAGQYAKPPSTSARMKLSVSAARSYARSMSTGSGSRLSAVNASRLMMSPRYAGSVTSPRVSLSAERGLAY